MTDSSTIPAQPSIWDELETWSKSFAPWQRLLLSGAIRHGTIPQAVLDQAYALFLVDHGLAKSPDLMPDVPTSVTGREKDTTSRARLLRVHSPSGINQLPHSAALTFAEGLTVIYGGNGVGKSGFARILSNACFSRQQHPIYPDVFDENAPQSPSATIEITDAAGNVTSLSFDGVTEHPMLKRGFAVFDSEVAQRHLKDTSPLGFAPTGFDVFAEMARGYAALQTKLAADIARRQRENSFGKAFIGPTTPASTAAATLSRFTDLDTLRALASFGDNERARIEQLQAQADQLRVNAPDAEIKRLTDARPHLATLKSQLAAARGALSDDALAADRRLSVLLVEAAGEVARQSAAQFSHQGLQGVGSSDWSDMIAAAGRLGVQQHLHYPAKGDICLLCQQPLDTNARDLFARYSVFLTGEARKKLEDAKARLQTRRADLSAIQLTPTAEGSVVHNFLAQSHPGILTAIDESTAKMAALRAALLAAFDGHGEHPGAIALPDFDDVIDDIIARLDSDLNRLRQSDIPASLKAVDDERTALRHREVLSQNLLDMIRFVNDAKWIAKAENDARGDLNPRHLTEKETELFGVVIADNYRNTLAVECEALDCGMPIEFKTQGKKGQTVRSLLIRNRPPDDILSEGEQRAVALADFLTEVALNEDNIGIILDDPVTSLDHDRKERIAARIVDEAQRRQVIVFTHDLVFFAKLADAAEKAGTPFTTHWMQRSADNKPGMVSLNDAPTTTPQYRKTTFAEDTLAKAKAAAGSAQELLVRQGAGQLRRTVEEIVPQYLFKEVVRRWTDRVMITSLRKVNWDNALADEIVDVFESCSAIMEGHSHTEAGAEAPPTPAKLEELITRTKNLITRAKTSR
jgi:hypothetical protein